MQIDVTDEKSFPTDIKRIVFEYLSLLSKDIEKRILENKIDYSVDVRCAIEDYIAPFKAPALYEKVIAVLDGCSIISYHATKVLDTESVRKNGLHTNTWEWYSKYLEDSLKALSFDEDTRKSALNLVEEEYNRKYLNNRRTAQICFFSGIRLLENEDGSAGYEQFCENIGGELARWALEDKMPEVYQVLKNSGTPIIVKVALPYMDLMEFLYESVAYQFVSYYAAKYYWDFEYEIDYDCITDKDVATDKILEIIPFGKR